MKKKKIETIGLIINIILTALFTITIFSTFNNHINNLTAEEELIMLVITVFSIYISMYLQLIIHELGHLIFGLITGYKFSSFRIGSFMIMKTTKKLKIKKLKVAGTTGQCLMSPPEIKNGKMPIVLYNLGGAILNVFSCIIIYLISILITNPSISTILELSMAYGLYFAALNAIPMKSGTIDNDGYNTLSLIINKNSQQAFWTQLKINELQAKGTRLKNMPEEWFYIPKPSDMKNSINASIAVFTCNRLLEQHKFEEANETMKKLLRSKTSIIGLHRNLLVCDRIFCELILDEKQKANKLMTTELNNFMNTMKDFPSVIRTKYTYALLYENNMEKAQELKKKFISREKNYPYPSEIRGEKELINIVTSIHKEK